MVASELAAEIARNAHEAVNAEVRVAFFGQPGSGKSSLINAITGQKLAQVGVETDVTRTMKRYEWNGLVLCDLPGYGTTRFPAETFMNDFDVLSFDIIL